MQPTIITRGQAFKFITIVLALGALFIGAFFMTVLVNYEGDGGSLPVSPFLLGIVTYLFMLSRYALFLIVFWMITNLFYPWTTAATLSKFSKIFYWIIAISTLLVIISGTIEFIG